MDNNRTSLIALDLALAVAVSWTSRLGWAWIGIVIVIVADNLNWIRQGELALGKLVESSEWWVSGVAVAIMTAATPGKNGLLNGGGHFSTADLLLLAYALWRIWLRFSRSEHKRLLVAGINQFLATAAIFLAATMWNLSSAAVISLVWVLSFIIAERVMVAYEDRAGRTLALAWGLVAAECAWIFRVWVFNYLLVWWPAKDEYLIIPQAALVITALGYIYGGIWLSHKTGKLSRGRLVEYIIIGLALFFTVIAGTAWNKVI